MELTRKFLESEKEIWSLKDILETYLHDYSQLKIFVNIPYEILMKALLTKSMVRDINNYHGLRLIDVMHDIVEIYPSEYRIIGVYEDKKILFYAVIDLLGKRFINLSRPFAEHNWIPFEEDPLVVNQLIKYRYI
jgi:hypothetical protein